MIKALVFAILLVATCPMKAENYPAIDVSSHWSVGSYNYGEVKNIKKTVQYDASLYSKVEEDVFRYIMLKGVTIGTNTYDNLNMQALYKTATENNDYKQIRGTYSVAGYLFDYYFIFYKNGKFEVQIKWVTNYPASACKFYFKISYCLAGMPNIIEFVEQDERGLKYYYGPEYEIFKSFSGETEENDNDIEKNIFCRVFTSDVPTKQFGAVFWQLYQTPIELTMKNIDDNDIRLPPENYINNTLKLQEVFKQTQNVYSTTMVNYPQYARCGNNQMCWITLKDGVNKPNYGFAGRLFKKPKGRPLRLYNYVMSDVPQDIPNFTLTINKVETHDRSIKTVLDDLTNKTWYEAFRKVNIIDDNPDKPYITKAQLHGWILSSGRQIAGNPIYQEESKENFTDWPIEIMIINRRMDLGSDPSGSTKGIMFDNLISSSDNNWNLVQREGCAVLWYAIKNETVYYNSDDERKRGAMLIYLHEIGHCIQFKHAFSLFGITIEERYIYNWRSNNVIYNWDAVDFYQNGPESWVKPGKYGVHYVDYDDEYNPPSNSYIPEFDFRRYNECGTTSIRNFKN
ncbi:MAG: hypothetical protein A2268_04220 [Candidatus Raymondbacteria bacterium RifOxyA12_full_50_37]|uniref:Uncharacterized protein n=1 Tax=Candidatus Raymondbacteria bacterium RIFOXYD12_FULL_49_13 TaxID=1817890 RepID=A0A1F7FBG5_UNCRA|nr:MAG: hypothetical protein A2268_04220 [Candidatus Raymondbacteria bacterium RifOxyA12_full_50_37]OGJ92571.1 MAG: hypothetical protein A2248_05730 [Candidatus Raymondbacteria bacterium RIFOXYA2_FULL_49_16]OGJ92867.1 MAG: hypothetical protein A2350_16840 [Candidatus Raymondbacteria bacterium RifOxyB12_full_50_8]OGJ97925.1 MAG: hypothetical protein A2453_02755 [Candidatus Raymondbacteria bacterium RIFOXYC2_FULL_50_21]OGK03961.1 MAG: hypothetical protein A2519_04530 [Candidatus Raymondbacteria b